MQAKLGLKKLECDGLQKTFERMFCDREKQACSSVRLVLPMRRVKQGHMHLRRTLQRVLTGFRPRGNFHQAKLFAKTSTPSKNVSSEVNRAGSNYLECYRIVELACLYALFLTLTPKPNASIWIQLMLACRRQMKPMRKLPNLRGICLLLRTRLRSLASVCPQRSAFSAAICCLTFVWEQAAASCYVTRRFAIDQFLP